MQDQYERGALSVPAAMDYLSVKRTKLYSLIASGQLKAVKLGRRTLVRMDELQRFLDTLPSTSARDKRSEGGV